VADHVFAAAGLADINAEFEEFAVDARSAQSGFFRLSGLTMTMTRADRQSFQSAQQPRPEEPIGRGQFWLPD
jgi:hypothetical protein